STETTTPGSPLTIGLEFLPSAAVSSKRWWFSTTDSAIERRAGGHDREQAVPLSAGLRTRRDRTVYSTGRAGSDARPDPHLRYSTHCGIRQTYSLTRRARNFAGMFFADKLELGKPRRTKEGYMAVRARAARA